MQLNRQLLNGLMTIGLGSALAFGQSTSPGQAGSQSGAQGQTPGQTKGQTQGESQDRQGQSGQTGARSGATKDYGMSSHKGAGLMVGKQDQQFITKAAQSNLMEIESARMAQEKASSPEIKEFARRLEQEHQKATEKLKTIAEQKNVDLPSDMGQHAAKLDKFRNLSGEQFDRAWINHQVQHHRKDVSEFQKHSNRAMDSDVKNFASTTLPTLQDHLRQAQELQGVTRGRRADTGRSANQDPNTSQHGAGHDTSNSKDRSTAPNRGNNPTPAPQQ